MQITSEEDFKAQKLQEGGFKKSQYKLGKVDIKFESVWIEAKKDDQDIYAMLAQIIFTARLQKLKSVDLPIAFGCFNKNKGALIDNYQVQEIFTHTDINWLQTPSNIDKKTVERIKFLLKEVQEYSLDEFGKEIKEIEARGSLTKKQITKNNFINVYKQWLLQIGNFLEDQIRPDCYLADLMTDGNKTIADKLEVVLDIKNEKWYYEYKAKHDLFGKIEIKDQKKYANFWAKYERPPAEEYQEYILNRRDLLQPNNARETKGAFFTPPIWADKSKEYLEKAFGKNWQDDYYIWDCACGTGNLELGLVNQTQVFMSTLDDGDLRIMEKLKTMPNATHFPFDFLNDDFKPKAEGGKIPNKLWQIITNSPQKLIIYINPPYLEVTNAKESAGTGTARTGATTTELKVQMIKANLGKESNELFMQFYFRIYTQIEHCKIGSFSKLKNCGSPNFENFRAFFKAKFCGGFVCRANTFDNVTGKFPISFQIWDCEVKEDFKNELTFDVLNDNGEIEYKKNIFVPQGSHLINAWFKSNNKNVEKALCYIQKKGSDFQNQKFVALYQTEPNHSNKITKSNLIDAMVYVAVRLCIPATWLNDRDQFTKPSQAKKSAYPNGHFTEVITGQMASNSLFDNTDDEYLDLYQYQLDQNFIGNAITFALFEKNFTSWQIFPNSEVELTGVERDMQIYDLLLKNRVFSIEANAVLNIAKQIYILYYQHFNNYNAGWNDVYKVLKKDKISKFDELWQEFKSAKQNLVEALQPLIYKYGFLKE